MRRPHCATCVHTLTPGDCLCAHTQCFACRVFTRAAALLFHRPVRPVRAAAQEQQTPAVRRRRSRYG